MPDEPAPVDLARVELYTARPADWMVGFVLALLTADELPTGELVYFLTRPEKWAPELVAWHSAGDPTSDVDAGWTQFVDALAELNAQA